MIAFDHDKLFNNERGRNLLKMDIGRKLHKNFVDIIENNIEKNLSVKNILMKLGFELNDFLKINKEEIKRIVRSRVLFEFLISRMNFDRIQF